MADPFSTAAGIVGITAVTLHSLKELLTFIDTIKKAPSAIANIKDDLKSVDAVLSSLDKTLKDEELLPHAIKTLIQDVQVEVAVTNCSKACTAFSLTLSHWMSHSSETKTFWWDQVRAGYFGEAKVQAFTRELAACKATVSVALNTANLYVFPNTHSFQEVVVAHDTLT
jgi:Fungal N-terminal domain of STAND proteins